MQPASITLGEPVVEGPRVSVGIAASESVRPFLRSNTLWFEYGSRRDLATLAEGTLIIPAVGCLAPVAWALGGTLQAPAIDRVFHAAVQRVGNAFGKMYPGLPVAQATIQAARVDVGGGGNAVGVFYSAGIDSTSSLIAHRADVGHTFTVWGADVRLDEVRLWRSFLQPMVRDAALVRGLTQHFIATNMRDVLDEVRLNGRFAKYFAQTDWWGGIEHGIAMGSLAAPIASLEGIGTLLLASSHSVDFSAPWGSSPATDNEIEWSGTRVLHDGFEATRQSKIEGVLAPYARDAGGEFPLAVCYQRGRGRTAINCGRCEKCIRTQAGLLAAGLDPASFGFSGAEIDLAGARRRFEAGELQLDENALFQWRDIQTHVAESETRSSLRNSGAFFEWLRSTDLAQYHRRPTTGVAAKVRATIRQGAELGFRALPFPVKQWVRTRLLRR